jgi:hypothetical protein
VTRSGGIPNLLLLERALKRKRTRRKTRKTAKAKMPRPMSRSIIGLADESFNRDYRTSPDIARPLPIAASVSLALDRHKEDPSVKPLRASVLGPRSLPDLIGDPSLSILIHNATVARQLDQAARASQTVRILSHTKG